VCDNEEYLMSLHTPHPFSLAMRHPLSAHLVTNAADSCEYSCAYSSSVQVVGGGTVVQSCGPACLWVCWAALLLCICVAVPGHCGA
jgi:hypothetical protein